MVGFEVIFEVISEVTYPCNNVSCLVSCEVECSRVSALALDRGSNFDEMGVAEGLRLILDLVQGNYSQEIELFTGSGVKFGVVVKIHNHVFSSFRLVDITPITAP